MNKTSELFDQENEARKRIEFSRTTLPNIKAGQNRRYYVGVNIGQEISKHSPYMRPGLVVSVVENSSLVQIIPLTTKYNTHRDKYLLQIRNPQQYGLRKSWLLLHQHNTIDKKRLQNRIQGKRITPGFLVLIKNKLFL